MLKLHRCAIKPRRRSKRANKRRNKQTNRLLLCAIVSHSFMAYRNTYDVGLVVDGRSVCIVCSFWCDRLCVCVCVYACAINAFLRSNLVGKSVVTAVAAFVETREHFHRKLKRCYNPFSFVMFLCIYVYCILCMDMRVNVDLFLLVAFSLFLIVDFIFWQRWTLFGSCDVCAIVLYVPVILFYPNYAHSNQWLLFLENIHSKQSLKENIFWFPCNTTIFAFLRNTKMMHHPYN